MIDGQEIFNTLPTAIRSKLGATEETYTRIESYANEGNVLLEDSDLSEAVKEKLAIIYAKSQIYLEVGYNEMSQTLMANFMRLREELENALEKEPTPEPTVYIEQEEIPFDEDELEKW